MMSGDDLYDYEYGVVPARPLDFDAAVTPQSKNWKMSKPAPIRSTSMELGPILVEGGHEDLVYRKKLRMRYPDGEQYQCLGLWNFIGLDRGDIVEADVEVAVKGLRLYQRSMHKEVMASFNSWEYFDTHYMAPPSNAVVVNLVCRVNGKQADREHPRYGQLTARVHFGVILLVRRV